MRLLIWVENTMLYQDIILRLTKRFGSSQVMLTQNLMELRQTLLKNRGDIEALFLAPSSLGSLQRIIEEKSFFDGTRLVIARPDTNSESMDLVLKLFPRYISHVQDPLENIEQVLIKMLNIDPPEEESDDSVYFRQKGEF